MPKLEPKLQSQMNQRVIAVLTVLSALFMSSLALAQTAEMTMAPISKNVGLRSGDFLLKPSITVMAHYDTNVFNASPQEALLTPIVGAASVRIQPRLTLQNDLTGNTVFNFGASGDGRLYLSSDPVVKNLNNFGGGANLDVTFGQRKPIAFTLFDTFNRMLRSNNWETVQTLNRNTNDVGARVEFHPGDVPERRPFNIALMGSYGIDRFEDFNSFNTNIVHTRMNGSWKFLPKTAAYVDATWDFRTFTNEDLIQRNLAVNTKPFRARAGVAGAITKRISFDVSAGWGMALVSSGVPGFNSWLGSVNFGFRPTETTRLTLGYTHDLRDAYLGGYSEVHKFGISAKQRFGTIIDVSANFGAGYVKYGQAQATAGISVVGAAAGSAPGYFIRHDWQLDGGLTASFEVSRYVGLQIGYVLRSVVTGFKLTSASTAVLDAGEYTAHEMFASVIGRY